LTSLQNAFFGPPLAIHLSRLDRSGRSDLVGGLYREQRRILPIVGTLALGVAFGLWCTNGLHPDIGTLIVATLAATIAILYREYFRMVLLAYRRPHDVLRTDAYYVTLMVMGVFVATFTRTPAITAIFTLCLAAIASAFFLARTLRRHESWNAEGAKNILREIAPLAAWSTVGSAIHWTFSQGYIYLVAGMLDVTAVAAIAATRLLLMPMNLLSTGISSLMLPLASGWLNQHGATVLLRRLCLFAVGLAAATVLYFAVVWILRDWIFAVVLKKQFAQRDTLLILWGAIVLTMVVRNQLGYLLAAQARFRALTSLTAVSTAVALAVSYWGMLHFGATGALVGMLIGELINVAGVATHSFRKAETLLATA
jgi:O-antigen/teichoic acid export membrane protein